MDRLIFVLSLRFVLSKALPNSLSVRLVCPSRLKISMGSDGFRMPVAHRAMCPRTLLRSIFFHSLEFNGWGPPWFARGLLHFPTPIRGSHQSHGPFLEIPWE